MKAPLLDHVRRWIGYNDRTPCLRRVYIALRCSNSPRGVPRRFQTLACNIREGYNCRIQGIRVFFTTRRLPPLLKLFLADDRSLFFARRTFALRRRFRIVKFDGNEI